MPVYLVLLVAVVVAVNRARRQIQHVEGSGSSTERTASRSDRWEQAPGVEKAAFVVMTISAAVWLLLVLPVGFAAAAIALVAAVWKRPYLETTFAPVVVTGGVVVLAYELLVTLVRDPGDWGAALINSALFGGLWIVIGVLLSAAAQHREKPGSLPAERPHA